VLIEPQFAIMIQTLEVRYYLINLDAHSWGLTIQNGQSRETGNKRNTHDEDKQPKIQRNMC
jgi:hypothetical protein